MSLFSKPGNIPGSLVWGRSSDSGPVGQLVSPIDQTLLQQYHLLEKEELAAAVCEEGELYEAKQEEIAHFARRLALALRESRGQFIEALQRETGFILSDSRELVDGALEYAGRFPCEVKVAGANTGETIFYRVGHKQRAIRIQLCSWGTIALILPQNAFLLLAVTGLLNALAAGNRVILRPPLQSACSAALFIEALQRAGPPQDAVSVVLCKGRDFMNVLHDTTQPYLIHFMGSSEPAADILADSFRNRKACLIDGEGNGWAYVDSDADVKIAADVLTQGALRYNGQTCTSVNGALIHPDIYLPVRQELMERWKKLSAGNPLRHNVTVGPLLSTQQAEWCWERLAGSGAAILCGNRREDNLLYPTLAENPEMNSPLVTQGLFGPALWIAAGDRNKFVTLWPGNRYPLSATVLSETPDIAWWSRRLSNLARLTFNGDPSEEYIFEPWGGYPATGSNRVSSWLEKYQRPVQFDMSEIVNSEQAEG